MYWYVFSEDRICHLAVIGPTLKRMTKMDRCAIYQICVRFELSLACDGLWWFKMSWNVSEWLKMFRNTMKCLENTRNVNIWPNDCKQFVGRSKRPIQFYIFTKRKALNQHVICDLLTRKPAEICANMFMCFHTLPIIREFCKSVVNSARKQMVSGTNMMGAWKGYI